MTRQPYPLESLLKLRDDRVQAHAQSLATQLARGQAAETTLRGREQARREHARAVAEIVALERERLARGELSGADLLRSAEFQRGARVQAEILQRTEQEARAALASEREKERLLREQLARSEADAKLVKNHAGDFREKQADQALRSEEEAALEQWNARRH